MGNWVVAPGVGDWVLPRPCARAYPRIKASIASASTGTPRLMSSQPVGVTMASSSMRMPMWWNCSGTPGAGAHVDAGLDGEHHAGLQNARGPVDQRFAGEGVLPLVALAQLGGFGVGAAVVHVHAQPVTGAVHVKLKVGALLDHVIHGAHSILVEQTHIQHALRQHLDGGLVRVGEARASAGGGYRSTAARPAPARRARAAAR